MPIRFSLVDILLPFAIASHYLPGGQYRVTTSRENASTVIADCHCMAVRPPGADASLAASADCPDKGPLCLNLGQIFGVCVYIGLCDGVPKSKQL